MMGAKKNFIKEAIGGNKGKFSAKAKHAGMSTAEFAKDKESAPGALGKEARLAETLSKMRKKK